MGKSLFSSPTFCLSQACPSSHILLSIRLPPLLFRDPVLPEFGFVWEVTPGGTAGRDSGAGREDSPKG